MACFSSQSEMPQVTQTVADGIDSYVVVSQTSDRLTSKSTASFFSIFESLLASVCKKYRNGNIQFCLLSANNIFIPFSVSCKSLPRSRAQHQIACIRLFNLNFHHTFCTLKHIHKKYPVLK